MFYYSRRLLLISLKSQRSNTTKYQIGLKYRKIQIIRIVCDECFQMYLWPSFQFTAGFFIIASLYFLIILHPILPNFVVASLLLTVITVSFNLCLFFDVGSRPHLKSVLCLKEIRNIWTDCPWTKRFVKSCSPIVLNIGSYHKMDRERVPNIIRFVLQRTFMLVFKNKMK